LSSPKIYLDPVCTLPYLYIANIIMLATPGYNLEEYHRGQSEALF